MAKIRTSRLAEGMKILTDIYDNNGAMVLKSGTVLDAAMIQKINKIRGLFAIEIEGEYDLLEDLKAEVGPVEEEYAKDVEKSFSLLQDDDFCRGLKIIALRYRKEFKK